MGWPEAVFGICTTPFFVWGFVAFLAAMGGDPVPPMIKIVRRKQ